jgi:5-methylcytosine-specific restriction endonuclease McrA
MSQALHDKLRYAQNLLGHAVAPSDLAQVFERALDALIPQLEKKRFAATDKPRPPKASSSDSRHIPAHVQRAVWARDGGQCTFKSADGHRCEARSDLEFDHVIPVARGGKSEVSNVRLLCGPHNQLEADRTYGVAFMEEKRRAASQAQAAGGTAGS